VGPLEGVEGEGTRPEVDEAGVEEGVEEVMTAQ
jgi:hypothetical protein